MRITYKGDYALKAMLDLALHYEKGLVTIRDMAKRIDAPVRFLEQVLFNLKKGGFVESRRGNTGGYLLARSPDRISISEVMIFIDGPIEPISCVIKGYTECRDVQRCVFRSIWQKVYKSISDIVDNTTFGELVSQVSLRQQTHDYSI